MSAADPYFTLPLSILRAGETAMDALNIAADVGIVNAGRGFCVLNDCEVIEAVLEEAEDDAEFVDEQPLDPPPDLVATDHLGVVLNRGEIENAWDAVLVGRKMMKVAGGCPALAIQRWARHRRFGEVFFRIRADFLWNAVHTARRETGIPITQERPPLSFREFRVLAAILSAPVNKHDFVFLGWESIQARSAGYHRKADLAEARDQLPPHCEVLSRKVIRQTTDRLEVLGFFGRFRYADGPRGGQMAYSFRHKTREALAAAVKEWLTAKSSFQIKLQTHRTCDRELTRRMRREIKASAAYAGLSKVLKMRT